MGYIVPFSQLKNDYSAPSIWHSAKNTEWETNEAWFELGAHHLLEAKFRHANKTKQAHVIKLINENISYENTGNFFIIIAVIQLFPSIK